MIDNQMESLPKSEAVEYLPKYCWECKSVEFEVEIVPRIESCKIFYYVKCVECRATYESLEEFGG